MSHSAPSIHLSVGRLDRDETEDTNERTARSARVDGEKERRRGTITVEGGEGGGRRRRRAMAVELVGWGSSNA